MNATAPSIGTVHSPARGSDLLARLNGPLHRHALWAFMAVVLLHWGEHLFQAWQIWVMGMPRHHALGALGRVWPWLVHSEALHYAYALVMLAGLFALWPGMTGRARTWWGAALALQFWHHLEHALLLGQVLTGWRLGGGAAPSSLLQLVMPRVELHLFYNSVVFVPMVLGMAYHLRPSAAEAARMTCACALRRASGSHAALGRPFHASILLALVLAAAPARGQAMEDGMTMPRRTLGAGVLLTHERWDRYGEGTFRRTNENIGTVTTRGATRVAGYGVTDRRSVTAMLPYVRTHVSGGTLREMHGIQDVRPAEHPRPARRPSSTPASRATSFGRESHADRRSHAHVPSRRRIPWPTSRSAKDSPASVRSWTSTPGRPPPSPPWPKCCCAAARGCRGASAS